MPWVRFTQDFNWDVPKYNGRVTIEYKAGSILNVPRAAAQAAISAGAAIARNHDDWRGQASASSVLLEERDGD